MSEAPERPAAKAPIPVDGGRIEFVRGSLSPATVDEILAFWRERGAPADADPSEVVCVLRGEQDAILGTNSVFPGRAEPIEAEFWVYSSLLDQTAAGAWLPMVQAAFEALHDEFNPARPRDRKVRPYPPDPARRPVGMCVPIREAELMERYADAAWDPPMIVHAGWAGDAQIRLGYFHWASATGDVQAYYEAGPLDESYRIEVFNPEDGDLNRRVQELWLAEDAIPPGEADRRIADVKVIARDSDGAPVGVWSAYIERNDQLRMDLWHARMFVAEAHRMSGVAQGLVLAGDKHLEALFTSGEDRRAAGLLGEIENEPLKRIFPVGQVYYPAGRWDRPLGTFIGLNHRGDHLRVRYFPGAKAPLP